MLLENTSFSRMGTLKLEAWKPASQRFNLPSPSLRPNSSYHPYPWFILTVISGGSYLQSLGSHLRIFRRFTLAPHFHMISYGFISHQVLRVGIPTWRDVHSFARWSWRSTCGSWTRPCRWWGHVWPFLATKRASKGHLKVDSGPGFWQNQTLPPRGFSSFRSEHWNYKILGFANFWIGFLGPSKLLGSSRPETDMACA